MTSFEYAVVSLLLLIAVLDLRKVQPDKILDMPRWYVYTFTVTAFITAISLANLALRGIFK